MTRDEATRRLHRRHVEKKSWPVTRNDPKAGPDGYIHYCAADHEPWPCLVHVALTTTDHPDVRAGLLTEALRMEKGWPTPMHMHRIADWLDAALLPARYGDVLRWVADACDADLAAARAALSATSEPT
jgi:hypothetical protein